MPLFHKCLMLPCTYGLREIKICICINGPGHMTNMAATPIYGKNLQHLLQNQKFDDFETWHEGLYKVCWVLGLFYDSHMVAYVLEWVKLLLSVNY